MQISTEGLPTAHWKLIYPVGSDLVVSIKIRNGTQGVRLPRIDNLAAQPKALELIYSLGIGLENHTSWRTSRLHPETRTRLDQGWILAGLLPHYPARRHSCWQ